MLKRVAMALIGGALMLGAVPAQAQSESKWSVGGTLTGASDYFFRGISQTDHIPAVQGSFDVGYKMSKPLGFFAGIWASNVDFVDGGDAHIEVDFYGGFQGEIKGFTWKLQFIYYYYPGVDSRRNYDYFEVNPSIGYDFGWAAFNVGLNISPDYFAASGLGVYLYGEASIPIPIKVFQEVKPTLLLSIGHQWIDDNAAFGTPDYLTWSVGVSIDVKGFIFSLKYIDTDLSKNKCFGGTDLCRAGVLFTLSKSF